MTDNKEFVRGKYLSDKKLYLLDFSNPLAWTYIPKDVMQQCVRVLKKAYTELAEILDSNKAKIHTGDWALHNIMDGEKIVRQEIIRYVETPEHPLYDSYAKKFRIEVKTEDVYFCDRKTAENIAKEINVEKYNKEKENQ